MNRIDVFTNESIQKHENQLICLEGFCYRVRVAKKMVFIVLRKNTTTIQLICFNDNPSYDILSTLTAETTISISGLVIKANVKTCTVTNYEIKVESVQVIVKVTNHLPFCLDDANEIYDGANDEDNNNSNNSNNSASERCHVNRFTRLENRWLDLRTDLSYKTNLIRSSLEHSIRTVLNDENFIEIHTPKLISASSEGGSNVFKLNYFDKVACLAQSPQLYKQMAVMSLNKVFEFGSTFRAEESLTYRHLCEFISLDLEFTIGLGQSHIDIVKYIWSILYRSFKLLESKQDENIKYILGLTNHQKLIFPEEPIIIDFKEGCEILNESLLKENKPLQNPLEDIGSEYEKRLGNLIKLKHNTDIYVLINYPSSARPFYTMKHNESNSQYSKSFDIMMRCTEISSGAQRIHDPEILKKSIKDKEITLEGSGLEYYVKSFESGALPHGGCGIGLERLVALYLGLSNVRYVSMFPRDPKRIDP
jgi:aspartyl/asparaginyl-tRNA synthetase